MNTNPGVDVQAATAAEPCPRKAGCPMVGRFVLQATLKTWQLRYCDDDYTSCVRYQLSLAGKDVPEDLLPNGKHLGAH